MDYNEIKKIIKTGMSNGKEVSTEDHKKIKKEFNSTRRSIALDVCTATISACGLTFAENSIIGKSRLESIETLEKELKTNETLRLNGQISDEEYEEQKKMINKELRRIKIGCLIQNSLLSFSNGIMAGAIIGPAISTTINDCTETIEGILGKYKKTSDIVKDFKEKK